MSGCRDFITANSSFSWWGTWLSESDGKRVVAPIQWLADADLDADDRCPPDWIRP